MRKLTSKAVSKFLSNTPFRQGNTEVTIDDGITYLKLHGNKIAALFNDGLWISNAGWFSNTTKERLNALPNVKIHQVNWNWFLNGSKWDGKPIYIGKI
jgi:hypothetical protein